MNDRSALGTADVTDEQLAEMAADLLGAEPADTKLLSSCVEEVDYDLAAITTAGRYWVRGTVEVRGRETPFQLFAKHVQAWSRSPLFDFVPVELQPAAAAGVPWRTEPLAYRSNPGDRLPRGLRMPRAVGVFDLDELSACVWLEVVETRPAVWDLQRYGRAAHLLGRLASDPRVRELADFGEFGFVVRDYLDGRLRHQVLDAAEHVAAYVEELSHRPLATSHGDACANNLLVPADDEAPC